MSDEPQLIEVVVNAHGGGKVAIDEYGKESVDYGASLSRRYSIPDGWGEDQIEEFESEISVSLRQKIDDLNQVEYEAAMEARKF